MPEKKEREKAKDKKEAIRAKSAEKEIKEAQKKEKKESGEKKGGSRLVILLLAIVAIAIIAAIYFVLPSNITGVSFSSFKSTFQGAPRVSIVGTYYNSSQYVLESACLNYIVQVVSYSRKPSTIDFYLINATTRQCEYSKSGLGTGVAIPATANASKCLATADSEPAIFINFTTANYTQIYANRLYEYGNAQYMIGCPIAVNLA
jgi:hypothetical protein